MDVLKALRWADEKRSEENAIRARQECEEFVEPLEPDDVLAIEAALARNLSEINAAWASVDARIPRYLTVAGVGVTLAIASLNHHWLFGLAGFFSTLPLILGLKAQRFRAIPLSDIKGVVLDRPKDFTPRKALAGAELARQDRIRDVLAKRTAWAAWADRATVLAVLTTSTAIALFLMDPPKVLK